MQDGPKKSNQNANENVHSCVAALKARLKNFEYTRKMLEAKLIEQDLAKLEVEDLQLQLDNNERSIKELTRNRPQQVYKDFDAVTINYDQNLDCMKKLKQENQDLEHKIQSKKVKELKRIAKREKLEINKAKIVKCINGLQEKINNEQASSTMLKLQQTDLEQAVASKMEETQKVGHEMANVKAEIKNMNNELTEMQRKSDEMDRNIKELKAQSLQRKQELTALRESGRKWLAKADQNADAVAAKLAAECTTAADWKCKREQLETACLQLKAVGDKERGCTRAALKALRDESDKLNNQLADLSCEMTAVVTDNKQLVIASKKEADRLDCLTVQMDRMEQRKCHERLLLSIQRRKRDAELTLLKNEKSVKDNKLLLAENEVEELKRTSFSRGRENDITSGRRLCV